MPGVYYFGPKSKVSRALASHEAILLKAADIAYQLKYLKIAKDGTNFYADPRVEPWKSMGNGEADWDEHKLGKWKNGPSEWSVRPFWDLSVYGTSALPGLADEHPSTFMRSAIGSFRYTWRVTLSPDGNTATIYFRIFNIVGRESASGPLEMPNKASGILGTQYQYIDIDLDVDLTPDEPVPGGRW